MDNNYSKNDENDIDGQGVCVSTPNISSLSSNELVDRQQVKISRQSIRNSEEPRLYHSVDDIIDQSIQEIKNRNVSIRSNDDMIQKALAKLNMVPGNNSRKEFIKPLDNKIQKIHTSVAVLIGDITSPVEFNHVRGSIIMDKIIHNRSREMDTESTDTLLLGSDDLIKDEDAQAVDDLISMTHKSRVNQDSRKGSRSIMAINDSMRGSRSIMAINDSMRGSRSIMAINDSMRGSRSILGLNDTSIGSNHKKENGDQPKTKKGLFQKLFTKNSENVVKSILEIKKNVDSIHSEVNWTPIIPNLQNYTEKSYSLGTIKRLKILKNVYNEIKDSENGVKYTSGKVSNTRYLKTWFTGSGLILWAQRKIEKVSKGNFYDDTVLDALTVCRLLFHLGFIVSVDRSLVFTDGDKPYIFQAPFFLPSEFGTPSHSDYARYLLRRSYFPSSKYKLFPWENTNLEMLRRLFDREWGKIEKQVDLDISFLAKQSKVTARIFKLQEHRFWCVQRSAPDSCEHFLDEEADFLRKQRLTDVEYEQSLTNNPDSLHSWSQRKIFELKDLLALKVTKLSVESSSLIEHCSTTSLLDPFLFDPCPSNPWISEDESAWDPNRPITVNEIKYWKSGLNFLLMDKRGVDLLWEFSKKEFSEENLKFISACRELQKSTTMQVFDRKAKHIYLEFVKQGATAEINIGSNIKKELHGIFIPLFKNKKSLLPEQTDLFNRAEDHILKLIEKDSYARFVKQELFSNNA